MRCAAPSSYGTSLADKLFLWVGQANWDNVLFVDHIAVKLQEGNVILEVGGVVVGMHLKQVIVRINLSQNNENSIFTSLRSIS